MPFGQTVVKYIANLVCPSPEKYNKKYLEILYGS